MHNKRVSFDLVFTWLKYRGLVLAPRGHRGDHDMLLRVQIEF
jgi:hypothetical protein